MYPISISGVKYFDSEGIDNFEKKLAQQLAEKLMVNEFNVDVKSIDKQEFEGAYFRFAWRPPSFLNMVSKGYCTVNMHKSGFVQVKFTLFFTEFFYYCLAFSSISLIFYNYWQVAVGALAAIWLLFLGGTMLLAQWQFNYMLSTIYKGMKPKKKVLVFNRKQKNRA